MAGGLTSVKAIDLAARMVAMAWDATLVHRLSFGWADQLPKVAQWMVATGRLQKNMAEEDIAESLISLAKIDAEVRKSLRLVLTHVPYRFLSPWISSQDNAAVALRSQNFENGCLYAIAGRGDDMVITLNPDWVDYINSNYQVLRSFALWNLTVFVQSRNPNVPNIAEKLLRQHTRSSLARQRALWEVVIANGCGIRCIYTGRPLTQWSFDLDHFVPWSFVCHDQMWNLVPADPSVNSSKSDRLPNLDTYLPSLAKIHKQAIWQWMATGKRNALLDDYAVMGVAPQDIAAMPQEALVECFRKTFAPLTQIAANMGFEQWERKL